MSVDVVNLQNAGLLIETDERGCWLWTAAISPDGYGVVKREGRTQLAHRYVYRLMHRSLDPEVKMDHTCRRRDCVNPAHLDPVTVRVNTLRGEGPTAQNARKTACYKGHLFGPENTQTTGRGRRQCRTCLAEQVAARTAQRRTASECPRGHPLDEANTLPTKSGGRRCRTCLEAAIVQRAETRARNSGQGRLTP